MEPEQHRELIDNFIGGSSRALILSDGYEIDLHRIPLVINYDFPTDHEGYARRVFGQDDQSPRKGIVINLITTADAKLLREIER
jgi:superfamily II DNA/RNA helicase